jgi:hypothetical protein
MNDAEFLFTSNKYLSGEGIIVCAKLDINWYTQYTDDTGVPFGCMKKRKTGNTVMT